MLQGCDLAQHAPAAGTLLSHRLCLETGRWVPWAEDLKRQCTGWAGAARTHAAPAAPLKNGHDTDAWLSSSSGACCAYTLLPHQWSWHGQGGQLLPPRGQAGCGPALSAAEGAVLFVPSERTVALEYVLWSWRQAGLSSLLVGRDGCGRSRVLQHLLLQLGVAGDGGSRDAGTGMAQCKDGRAAAAHHRVRVARLGITSSTTGRQLQQVAGCLLHSHQEEGGCRWGGDHLACAWNIGCVLPAGAGRTGSFILLIDDLDAGLVGQDDGCKHGAYQQQHGQLAASLRQLVEERCSR